LILRAFYKIVVTFTNPKSREMFSMGKRIGC
jgi:hypothetical protein